MGEIPLSVFSGQVLFCFECVFELLSDLGAYFVVESCAEFWEGFVVEDSPDDSVVECEVSALELGNSVVSPAVLHVEEPEVGEYPDEDGL